MANPIISDGSNEQESGIVIRTDITCEGCGTKEFIDRNPYLTCKFCGTRVAWRPVKENHIIIVHNPDEK
jgi:hypothetical protein